MTRNRLGEVAIGLVGLLTLGRALLCPVALLVVLLALVAAPGAAFAQNPWTQEMGWGNQAKGGFVNWLKNVAPPGDRTSAVDGGLPVGELTEAACSGPT